MTDSFNGIINVTGSGALNVQVESVTRFAVSTAASTFSSVPLKMASGNKLWHGNTIATGLTPATVVTLLTKSIVLQDLAGNDIVVYGS